MAGTSRSSAVICFVLPSRFSSAKETVLTEEQAATPETAESARLSLTVLDSDYSGSKNGNIDESLFYTETDYAEIAAGKIVPLLLQVDGPAQGSSVTVKLDESGQFCDPRGQELSGQEWKRTFQQESQSAWMLYVTSGADFTVTAVYPEPVWTTRCCKVMAPIRSITCGATMPESGVWLEACFFNTTVPRKVEIR